jgi:hypothetical protein
MSEHCSTASGWIPLTIDAGEIGTIQTSAIEDSPPDTASVPKTISDAGKMMTTKMPKASGTASIARKPAAPRVRVKLHRVHANLARSVPPDGDSKAWWGRLKSALGTTSSAFVDASLYQLQAAARLPGSGISEIAVNAALAMIEAAGPKDEIEGALAVQMACTHTAAMAVLARLGAGHGSERRVAALGSAAGRLLRAYAMQVETFRRLRRGGDQHIRVEHVHVHAGGQAIVGAVSPR